jgi:hypothetical protein
MISSTDFPTLKGKLNEWYNEAANDAVAEWVGQSLFDVGETDWETYNYLGLYGMAKFERVAEGQQMPAATSAEGDSTSAVQKQFGGRITVTKRMRKFDRYDQIQELVRDNVNFAFDRIDQSQADLLLNGFAGSSYTDLYGYSQTNLAPDAVVLFSVSHSNNLNANLFRNLIRNSAGTANPALSRDAIVTARKDARIYRDPNNANRPTVLDTLIVPATLEDLAERTVYSSGVQGTPNVDINPLKGKVSNIKVWSRLDTRSDSTDTSAYWFMADSKNVKKSLKSPFAQKPLMTAPTEIHDSLNWEWIIDSFYVIFAGMPKNIWGSTGVA